jgi:hypothetical protein
MKRGGVVRASAPIARRGPRAGRWLAFGLLVFASHVHATSALAQPVRADSLSRAPAGARVRVRVLNGTATRGLAKRATFLLRDLGYDVVDYDTDAKAKRSETLIRSHTGHTEWAERLRRALGTGTVENRPEGSRYVDFTVFLGSDWKAPAKSFRP